VESTTHEEITMLRIHKSPLTAVARPATFVLLALGLALGAGAASAAVSVNNITATYSCDTFGCSVVFNNYVCNNDRVNSASYVVGSRWDGSGSISTCTGWWDSEDSYFLGAGGCGWITTYGPGYIGAKISPTSCVTVTSNADIYCHVSSTPLTKTVCK
jgi:hypothetical protein